jgi:hypothetical protein
VGGDAVAEEKANAETQSAPRFAEMMAAWLLGFRFFEGLGDGGFG